MDSAIEKPIEEKCISKMEGARPTLGTLAQLNIALVRVPQGSVCRIIVSECPCIPTELVFS